MLGRVRRGDTIGGSERGVAARCSLRMRSRKHWLADAKEWLSNILPRSPLLLTNEFTNVNFSPPACETILLSAQLSVRDAEA